jgi:hypothetical protein
MKQEADNILQALLVASSLLANYPSQPPFWESNA